jgi:ABC-2 type transport system ATP-binding protein
MAPAAIRTLGLTKNFGRVIAPDGLDLDVSPGEIFGFLGPNGAGKSTTLCQLPGLIRPTAAATSSSATFAHVQARAW